MLVPFPFSDLSRAKLRPAVVLADAGRGDWILCQITSKPYADAGAVLSRDADFAPRVAATRQLRPAWETLHCTPKLDCS